jgi:hypothetical protein
MDKLKALIRRWLHLDWVEIPLTDPLSATTHGEHKVEFVSRHSIAETGLTCPVCGTDVAPLGSYIMVQRSRLGEVVVCNGRRIIQDTEVPCGMQLCASPDTEHGDHLIYDKVPLFERHNLFHSFVRISKGDAVRLKYGADVKLVDGQMIVSPAAPTAPKTIWPPVTMEPGEVWYTDLEKPIEIISVQVDDDPLYHGWAKGRFQNTPDGATWNIDKTGFIRQSMSDPTQNDRGRLLHKV